MIVTESFLPTVNGVTGSVLAPGVAYGEHLDERGHHLVTLARMIAGSTEAVLVHGAEGRHRTGLAVGLLLDAVGVERSAVISDYTAAGDARPAVLTELLERVEDDRGGAASWLQDGGLTADDLAALRRRLLRYR